MHKVININIGGRIFSLEDNAFEALNNYISSLKSYFGNKPEGIEIIADIENRIAELLEHKIKISTNISIEEINEIIASMGSPKDIAGDDESRGEFDFNSHSESSSTHNHGKSRLFRDPDGKVISGVCSGLSYYFNMDASIIRIIFVAMFFAGGSSIFIYLILLIVIPEARTTAEKLAMRKEKINVDTIRKSVEEEFVKVKGAFENSNYQGKISGFFEKIFHVIALVVKACIRLVSVIVGFVFAVVAFALFITLITFITGNSTFNGIHFSVFDPIYIQFFENANDRLLSQVAIISGLFALILVFFNFSRTCLTQVKNYEYRRTFNRITLTLFLLSTVLGIISAAKIFSYFHSLAKVEKEIKLNPIQKHFVIKTFYNENHGMNFFVENDTLNRRIRELKIEYTAGPAELVQCLEARGKTIADAKKNASNCNYNLAINDSVIILPESFNLKNNQAYRKQKVSFILKLPAGSTFTVDKNSNLRLLNNDSYDEFLREGETYVVDANGLHCIGCTNLNSSLTYKNNDYQYNYPVSEFKSITVSSKLHVKIIKGNVAKVLANGLDRQSELIVESGNNELDVYLESNFLESLDNDDIEVLIITPELSSVQISGAVNAEIIGFENEMMDIFISGASKCMASLNTINLEAKVSGASDLTLNGIVNSMKVDLSGAGKLYANQLIAQIVDIQASGASKATLHAEKILKAKASGASKIEFTGHPMDESIFTSGAGTIKRTN